MGSDRSSGGGGGEGGRRKLFTVPETSTSLTNNSGQSRLTVSEINGVTLSQVALPECKL